MEGEIAFGAMPTPTWEQFETVTLTCTVNGLGGTGAVNVRREMPVEEARAFAGRILSACDVVENDQRRRDRG